MQLINVNELKPHEKNNYFFDDIQGDNWSEFIKSIQTSGVIEPVIITQDKTIVSGHQRVKACKELSIQEIPCEVKIYESEENILKDLLETNLRQRGIGNTNAMKFARCIQELEKIYSIQKGNNQYSLPNNSVSSQNELAQQFNISVDQLQNYKKLLTLIPELQDSIENGTLSPTVGYKVLAKLSKEQQEDLIKDFGKDYIASITQKKAEELKNYVQEKAILEQKIKEMEKELSERPTIEKEVPPSDYQDIKKKLTDSQEYYNKLKSNYNGKVNELSELRQQIKSMTELKPEEQYSKKLNDDAVIFCAKVEKFISQVGGLAYLADHINDLPKNEQRAYIKTVELVESWANNIKINLKQYI